MLGKGCTVLCFILLVCCLAVANPIHLESKNFLHKVSDGNIWFVMFYAPWCGACAQVKPTWVELSSHPTAKIASVDCTVATGLCRLLEVPGFPMFILFRDGQQYKYSGPRTIDSFTQFITNDYLKREGSPILPKDTVIPPDSDFMTAIDEILKLAKQNYFVAITLGAVWFFMIGCCLGSICEMFCRPSPARHSHVTKDIKKE